MEAFTLARAVAAALVLCAVAAAEGSAPAGETASRVCRLDFEAPAPASCPAAPAPDHR